MSPPSTLDEILQALPSMTRVLGDEKADMALLRSDGTWHLEKEGAVRLQTTPLPAKTSTRLVELVSRHGPQCVLDHWWVRSLSSNPPSTIVFERRPGAALSGLSRHTVELLRSRIEPGANGLVFGESQDARAGILLSLTRFLPADLIVYVGPVPPLPADGVSLLHVAPPRDDRDRRELAMLFERASAVLFDGSIRRSDIRILFPNTSVTNRWLAVDSSNPDEWASSFVLPPSLKAPVTTRIGVRTAPTQPIRLTHLSVRHDGKWHVLLEQDDFDDDSVSQEETTTEGTPVRLSAQITAPIDHRSGSDKSHPPSRRKRPSSRPSPSASMTPDEAEFNVKSLLRDNEDDTADPARESGLINVPGFVSGSPRRRTDHDAQETAEELPGLLQGKRIDDDLPSLIAAGDIDEIKIPSIDPEQLRQTYSNELDSESLKKERERHRRAHGESSDTTDASPSENELATKEQELPGTTDSAEASSSNDTGSEAEPFEDDGPETQPITAEPKDLESRDDSGDETPTNDDSADDPTEEQEEESNLLEDQSHDESDNHKPLTSSTSSASTSDSTRSREFRRTSQLAADSSASNLPRKTPSKRRVLPIPSSDSRGTEATTTELGAFDSEEVRDQEPDSDAESH